jgi:hypothetical protein
MNITARFAMWSSIVFAIICLGVAINGFSGLEAIADDAQRADGRGFAYFWLFLGMVAVACALASRWIIERDDGADGPDR